MSLATLKRKTASKYNNNSVNKVFSINGTHRNQGYIGQTSLSRTYIHTPKKGTTAQGHGSCCGEYLQRNIQDSSICTTEDASVVKRSVVSNTGMLAKRNRWVKRPHPYSSTKPSDSMNQSTSGDYIIYKRKNEIKESKENEEKCQRVVADGCCQPIKAEIPNETKSQGEYILGLISECANLDISYIEYHTESGPPLTLC